MINVQTCVHTLQACELCWSLSLPEGLQLSVISNLFIKNEWTQIDSKFKYLQYLGVYLDVLVETLCHMGTFFLIKKRLERSR